MILKLAKIIRNMTYVFNENTLLILKLNQNKNFMKTKVILIALVLGTISFSCNKDEDTPTPSTATTTPTGGGGGGNSTGNAQPNFPGADASLWAVKSLSVTEVPGFPPITTTIGIGVGVFFDSGSNYVDVGTVQLNSNPLTKNPNNSYTYTPGQSNPTGIDFSGGVNWNVAGGNGFTAINKNVTLGFPTVSEITSSSTVSKTSGYTLTVNTVTGADSVLFLIGDVNKTIAGNATSCTFSSSELSSLSNGSTVAQVAAYISTNETLGGKIIYYGNETVQSKTVTVQ